MAKRVLEKSIRENSSCSYQLFGFVDYDQNIAKGDVFFDGGRLAVFSSLDELKLVSPKNAREIIVGDINNDAKLKQWLEKNILVTLANINSKHEMFKLIATMVFMQMQGTKKSEFVEEEHKKHISAITDPTTNVVMLGDVTIGVCRHRAILFKLACDYVALKRHINLKCKLVRYVYVTPNNIVGLRMVRMHGTLLKMKIPRPLLWTLCIPATT